MNIQKQKLWVCLDSSENPSVIFQGSRNAKIAETYKNIETVYYEISNLSEASEICRKYISYFNLGSGNFSGGRVLDDNNNFIARVSYNGRIWNSENHKEAKEIEI